MFSDARRQLTLIYAAAGVVTFGILAVGIYLVLVAALDREIDIEIEHVLTEGIDLVSLDPEGTRLDVPTAFGPAFLFGFSSDGIVISNPRDLPVFRVVPADRVRSVAASGVGVEVTRTVDGERFRLHLEPVARGDAAVAVLVAGRSLARRDAEVRLVTWTLAGSAVVWTVLASAIAYVVAGRALRPMRQAYARQEAFVAGAAHELRSPIGVIRAASEVALRGEAPPQTQTLLREINDVATDASTLVDTLLDLARMRQEATDFRTSSALAEVVARELSRMDLLLREHDVRVVDDLGAVDVRAPEAEIGRIARALLENVIAHTPRGTTVIVRTRHAGAMGELVVEDNGPGIEPDDLETVFAPFARGDDARRRGHRVGMGLAIVQTVAEHYGGRVRARPSERGPGLVVEVHLPVA
ncbi:MAG: sensor histidine kinase [Dehalococcoidia bacterium]